MIKPIVPHGGLHWMDGWGRHTVKYKLTRETQGTNNEANAYKTGRALVLFLLHKQRTVHTLPALT